MAWKMERPGQPRESSVHETRKEAEAARDRLVDDYRQAGISHGGTGLGADLIRDSIKIYEVDGKEPKKRGWLW